MSLFLTNTCGRKKELFATIDKDVVKIYTCGPTVYDYVHIGNFRTFLFEDLLRRYLKHLGFKIIQVMNITDVDDKTIQASSREGLSLKEYTEKYVKFFFQDLDMLRIQHAEFYPRATDHIDDMVEIISVLLKHEFAYQRDDAVYFDVSKRHQYGKLSRISSLRDKICY